MAEKLSPELVQHFASNADVVTKTVPSTQKSVSSKAKSVFTLLNLLLKPVLPGVIQLYVQNSKTEKDNEVLREVRDILVASDLGDSKEDDEEDEGLSHF